MRMNSSRTRPPKQVLGAVVSLLGVVALAIPIYDIWKDTLHGWSFFSSFAENLIFILLALILVIGGWWLGQREWDSRYAMTVVKWTVLGTCGAAAVFGIAVGLQLWIAHNIKPFIIALDGVLTVTVAMFLGGILRAGNDRRATELEAKHDRLSALFHSTTDAVAAVEFTPDGQQFTKVNENFEAEFAGKAGTFLSAVVTNLSGDSAREDLLDQLQSGESTKGSLHHHIDGESREFLVRLVPYSVEEENVGAYLIATDLTRRRQREQALETLHSVSQDLSRTEVRSAVAAKLTEAAHDILGANSVGVYLYDEDRQGLRPVETRGDIDDAPYQLPIEDEVTETLEAVYEAGEREIYENETNLVAHPSSSQPVQQTLLVPVGDHGVLAAVDSDSTFPEQTTELAELLAASAESALDRVDRERILRKQIDQQEAITEVSQQALSGKSITELCDEVLNRFPEIIDMAHCGLLDLDLDSDVPWTDDETVRMSENSIREESDLPVPVDVVSDGAAERTARAGDGQSEDREVWSSITADIRTSTASYGVLRAYNTDARTFTDYDENALQTIANILAAAIDRRDQERQLEHQREELQALENLNAVIRELNYAAVQKSDRETLERLVCEHLAEVDSYSLAWIGELDEHDESVTVRTESGVDGFLDETTITVGDDASERGPTERAFRTQEVQVEQDLSDARAQKHGYRSMMAIPITHAETLYGVLHLYSEREDAFDDSERAIVGQLSEILGHAYWALEREQALVHDEVTEVELRIPNFVEEILPDDAPPEAVDVDQVILGSESPTLAYGTIEAEHVDDLESFEEGWADDVRILDEGDERSQFELRIEDSPITSAIIEHGMRLESAKLNGDDFNLVVTLPPDMDPSPLVETIEDEYPDFDLIAQRRTIRDRGIESRDESELTAELTSRQRAVLKTAYFGGYFEWPRESNGEEIAESLDISPPTFQEHLRTGERKILREIFEEESTERRLTT